MAIETATVETLTAEVRTLMVGSRQVTLSVFKQLDTVDPIGILPMGRVSYQDNDLVRRYRYRWSEFVWVVGRSSLTGNLVRAYSPVDPYNSTSQVWLRLPLIVLAGLR